MNFKLGDIHKAITRERTILCHYNLIGLAINKIEGTPILKLAIIKRLWVKKVIKKLSKNSSKRNVQRNCQKKESKKNMSTKNHSKTNELAVF